MDSSDAKQPQIDYKAIVISTTINGDVTVNVHDESLKISSRFDIIEIPYAMLNSIALDDFSILLETDIGNFAFTKMGNSSMPFFLALTEAYNNIVLKALFVDGTPNMQTKGAYQYGKANCNDTVPLHVYENCVVCLPSNLDSVRIPLCYLTDLQNIDYRVSLSIGPNEQYIFSKLGRETQIFEDAIDNNLRLLNEKTLAAIMEIESSLQPIIASQLARLLPEGVSAPLGKINSTSPEFVSALENKLSETVIADYCKKLFKISNPVKTYIGFKKNDVSEAAPAGNPSIGAVGSTDAFAAVAAIGAVDSVGSTDAVDSAETPDPFMIWLIAPSQNEEYAIVEFAEANSATFVYKTGGNFDYFASQLNRALEAISFKREVIRLTDEELKKTENNIYFIANKRTAALQFVRSNFVGRVIHSSPDTWENKLLSIIG